MNTPNPRDVVTQLLDALNQGDLETVLSFFEPNGSFVPQPGVVATGTVALRKAFAGFLALKPNITSTKDQLVQAGDVALYCAQFSMRATDAAGKPVQSSPRSSDVLRRQPDGNWLMAVDNPWGTDIVG